MAEPQAEEVDWQCYRHPDRSAGVRCRRCERPVCPDCMITAPVGFQCPTCVKGAPAVRSLRSLKVDPYVTYALIAINLAAFAPSLLGGAFLSRGSNSLAGDFALFGPAVGAGEWWRLVTSGFLHYGLIHIGFNMLILYQLGQVLEPAFGRLRFGLLYFAALLAGSTGVLILQPNALTAGASGAVYGLMGALVAAERLGSTRLSGHPMLGSIVPLLVINLFLTFAIPGISIGGHIGGLVGGAAAGAILVTMDRPAKAASFDIAAIGLLILALFGASVLLA